MDRALEAVEDVGRLCHDDLEALRAPLGPRRHAGVVDEVALDHVQLAVRGFDFEHVGFSENAFDPAGAPPNCNSNPTSRGFNP